MLNILDFLILLSTVFYHYVSILCLGVSCSRDVFKSVPLAISTHHSKKSVNSRQEYIFSPACWFVTMVMHR